MNKMIIFGAVGAVSLIAGIAAGIVHRSNKRYRRALSELEIASEVLDKTTDVLEETIDFFERRESFVNDLIEKEGEAEDD